MPPNELRQRQFIPSTNIEVTTKEAPNGCSAEKELISLHVPTELEVAEALGETTFPINPSEASRLQNTDGYVETQNYYLNETADTNVPVKKYFYNSVQRRYQISGKQR